MADTTLPLAETDFNAFPAGTAAVIVNPEQTSKARAWWHPGQEMGDKTPGALVISFPLDYFTDNQTHHEYPQIWRFVGTETLCYAVRQESEAADVAALDALRETAQGTGLVWEAFRPPAGGVDVELMATTEPKPQSRKQRQTPKKGDAPGA